MIATSPHHTYYGTSAERAASSGWEAGDEFTESNTSLTYLRVNDTWVQTGLTLSTGTVTAQTAYGAASANGSAATLSPSDHAHGTVAHELPAAGTTNQALVKNSNTDYDVKWAAGGGGMSEDTGAWEPDAPPSSAGASDDEFAANAGAGTPAGWTSFDPGTSQTASMDKQGMTLKQVTHAGDKVSGIYKAIPAGDFTIWTHVGMLAKLANFCLVGLAIWENAADSTKRFYMHRFSNTDVGIQHYTNYTTWSGNDALSAFNGMPNGYLRIRRASTTYSFDWSWDGLGWLQLFSSTILFVPTHFGLAVNNNNTGADLMGRYKFFRYVASDVGITGLMSGDRIGLHRYT